ncbi:DUF1000-domain-containing protein [Punctularia strigosozonata HHB-11173 SS5]|uniref:DUF1000-domain-containing protein n=1 Tax=Punctularia strigosozonata (strain HHB-11173) TaxID=741275 RepID=R7S5R7_PUNST|nr:DUF1000-domain-containing protein [Punctularia strigosozonata HHB-11173 SS5]EIN04936.1 DUF1000-domain-containing protein [Punctularia strigosozonata HHB-11173 SS5]
MAHDHSHCGDECNDHDHDHGQESLGAQDNLYSRVDHQNVVALNATNDVEARQIVKPWHERLDEGVFLKSDADDQMIIRIPFTGSVKLRAVLIKAGPGDQTPSKVLLYPNRDNLDFSDVNDTKPVQEFRVAQGRDVGEYAVMPAKFSAISSLTLFFPGSQGADNIRIYYIGLLGQWTERKRDPVITVYETQANLADHEKIQGTDGAFSSPQM